jgi:hypothetical protein
MRQLAIAVLFLTVLGASFSLGFLAFAIVALPFGFPSEPLINAAFLLILLVTRLFVAALVFTVGFESGKLLRRGI